MKLYKHICEELGNPKEVVYIGHKLITDHHPTHDWRLFLCTLNNGNKVFVTIYEDNPNDWVPDDFDDIKNEGERAKKAGAHELDHDELLDLGFDVVYVIRWNFYQEFLKKNNR